MAFPFIILWGFCVKGARRMKQGGDDLLFISQYHWENVWRRNQHVAKHLSRARKIFYLTPFPATSLLKAGANEALSCRGEWVTDDIYALSLPVLPGENKFRPAKALNSRFITAAVKLKSRRLNISPGILWFSHPYAESMTQWWQGAPVIYDVQDEYPKQPTAHKDLFEREVRLLGKSDLVLTGTYSLYLKKKQYTENIHFVGCGVDFDHFNHACKGECDVPEDMAGLKGEKVLGYFGEVGSRIDWPLLKAVGEKHPNWDIVLIGGVNYVGPEVSGLENIHILGKKKYEELSHYIRAFDICLIPFIVDDFTRYINPTKLLEYLAAGKPVISSPIPDVERFYSEVVGIAGDLESFEEAVSRIENGSEKIKMGIEMARNTSWEKAVREMERHLQASIPSRLRQRKRRG
jgi:glycosyltransferase involved in cell wall biosynthesis